MKISNFDEVIDELHLKLPEYLESFGIDTSKNFSCINPDHNDTNPSCSINGNDNKTFSCLSCGAAGNLFNAAHLLENKPLNGPEFITENLLFLSNKFDIDVDMEELTDEERWKIDTHRAYRHAAELLTITPAVREYAINDRGIQEAVLDSFNVGGVKNFASFIAELNNLGFSNQFLRDIDLYRSAIFNEGSIVFTIHDEKGRPVGFAARDIFWNKESTKPKYVNQKTSGVLVNIYQKRKRLYGLHKAVNTKPLYLVEGQVDVLNLQQNNVNAAGLCMSSLTKEQILVLREFGYTDIILCLDNDSTGSSKTEKIVDSFFEDNKDFSIRIKKLPVDHDPDSVIRNQGIEAFLALPIVTAFEWKLDRFYSTNDEASLDDLEVASQMINIIAAEPSFIKQEAMCKSLALRSGVSLSALLSELKRRLSFQEQDLNQKREAILASMNHDIQRNPDNTQLILSEAQHKLQSLDKIMSKDTSSFNSCLDFLSSQKLVQEAKEDKFCGFRLGPDLKNLEQALEGEWKKDTVFILGSKANVGKTSLFAKICYSIAAQEDNDAIVVYHTIDDTKEQAFPKLVCIAEGSRDLPINAVVYPKFYGNRDPSLLARRQGGYALLQQLVKEKRFMIIDANDGADLSFTNNLLANLREEYPNKNIVYALDNFHVLKEFKSFSDERIKFKQMSQLLKSIATTHHVSVLATNEYHKLPQGVKPSNYNLAESNQMEYDSNIIAHLYSDLHEFPDSAICHFDKEGNKMPIVEMIIGKNKVSSFKGSIYFNFYPYCSDFVAVEQ